MSLGSIEEIYGQRGMSHEANGLFAQVHACWLSLIHIQYANALSIDLTEILTE